MSGQRGGACGRAALRRRPRPAAPGPALPRPVRVRVRARARSARPGPARLREDGAAAETGERQRPVGAMTGEKKKKKRLNRSVLLAKKIVIRDGAGVSVGTARGEARERAGWQAGPGLRAPGGGGPGGAWGGSGVSGAGAVAWGRRGRRSGGAGPGVRSVPSVPSALLRAGGGTCSCPVPGPGHRAGRAPLPQGSPQARARGHRSPGGLLEGFAGCRCFTGREMSMLMFNIRFEGDKLSSDPCEIFTSRRGALYCGGRAAEAPDSAGDSVVPEPRQL